MSTICCVPASLENRHPCPDLSGMTAMKQEHDKHEGETFDLKQAKAHYIAMPTWERLALWVALGAIVLGIIGDLIW
jgi:hypothetical protein